MSYTKSTELLLLYCGKEEEEAEDSHHSIPSHKAI